MPKVDIQNIDPKLGSDYPSPFGTPVAARQVRDLGAAGGGTDLAANHVTLPPGCWSSQRHWHEGEDEIVAVLAGEAMLVDDNGRHTMRIGDVALFPKGDGNGHHLVNEGSIDCILLAIGRPENSPVHYPDIDLRWSPDAGDTHADGTSYTQRDLDV